VLDRCTIVIITLCSNLKKEDYLDWQRIDNIYHLFQAIESITCTSLHSWGDLDSYPTYHRWLSNFDSLFGMGEKFLDLPPLLSTNNSSYDSQQYNGDSELVLSQVLTCDSDKSKLLFFATERGLVFMHEYSLTKQCVCCEGISSRL